MDYAEAEDALLVLAMPLLWREVHGVWIASGPYAEYVTQDPSTIKSYEGTPHAATWRLLVSSVKTEKGFRVGIPTFAELKALAARHAMTGDASDLLELAKGFDWSEKEKGVKALVDGGCYLIRKKRVCDNNCVYSPKYQHLDKQRPVDFLSVRPYLCPHKYDDVDDAKLSCKQHYYLGEWKE